MVLKKIISGNLQHHIKSPYAFFFAQILEMQILRNANFALPKFRPRYIYTVPVHIYNYIYTGIYIFFLKGIKKKKKDARHDGRWLGKPYWMFYLKVTDGKKNPRVRVACNRKQRESREREGRENIDLQQES